MGDQIINAMAEAFANQRKEIENSPEQNQILYNAQLSDDTIAMAWIIRKFAPRYDINLFFEKCNYPGTYPQFP